VVALLAGVARYFGYGAYTTVEAYGARFALI
jgi:hypothetical protein